MSAPKYQVWWEHYKKSNVGKIILKEIYVYHTIIHVYQSY